MMQEEKEKTKIEKTSNISDPELTLTASITKEVVIGGTKTWIGLSEQFLVRDVLSKDALEIVLGEVEEFCEGKGATAIITSQTQAPKPLQQPPPQEKPPQTQTDIRPDLPWHDTSNPNIKRLREQDTPNDVLAEAQSKKVWGLWYSPPSESFDYGSVFKDLSKLGKQRTQSSKPKRMY